MTKKQTKPILDPAREEIDVVSVDSYGRKAYLNYAMSVVRGRAIPYLEDGQKPVQRRTLYTMNTMRLHSDVKPVKSAKIIGTVLGSYHPHGDQSVYDAMVRQTQSFVMRYPLVHGEGNFGSRDGDGAAAMRYCFVGNTLIHTSDGLERIIDIAPKNKTSSPLPLKINKQVRSLTGINNASKWFFSGVHETVKVKTSLGFEVECTTNEPFYTYEPNTKNFIWKEASAFKKGDGLCLSFDETFKRNDPPLPSPITRFFSNQDDFLKFISLLYSNFFVGFVKNKFMFRCNAVSPTFFNEKLNGVKGGKSEDYNLYLLSFECDGLMSALKESGYLNSQALPEYILKFSKETKLSLLSYLFEYSDTGSKKCVSFNKYAVRPNFQHQFCSELQILALSVGILLEVNGNILIKKDINDFLCADDNRYVYDTIESITLTENQRAVFDLTVDVTHAFVANGFVAHNTEAKLSNYSKLLLDDMPYNTVDFRPNYDGTTTEPEILPARLPFILMNGAEGVGVGMSCSIPPHRAEEIAKSCITLLREPGSTFEEVMSHIEGPDFPTGGHLIQPRSKILEAYKEGNGTLKLRGRWDIETGARGSWKLIIKELPYGVSPQRIMEQVDSLLNPKPKERGAKKEFTNEQIRIKQLFNNMIDTYRDESGKEQAVRVVFEPKTFKQEPQDLIDSLLVYTSLQDTVKINLVVVDRERRATCKGILSILKEWNEFRVEITRRRLENELSASEKRLHIVEGRLKVIDMIQEAIRVIQSSDDPKNALMEKFGLSEIQATDVLDMRLRQLARLEGDALVKEKTKLEKNISRLKRILSKSKELVGLVINEIEADIKFIGDDPRLTIVEEISNLEESSMTKTKTASLIPEEAVTLAISSKFWARAKLGLDQPKEAFVFKTGDSVSQLVNSTTHQTLFAMDHTGRIYSMDMSEIPSGRAGDGTPLSSVWDLQGKLEHCWAGSDKNKYLLASSSGKGFIVNGSDLKTRMKAGKTSLVLDNDAAPMFPINITDFDFNNSQVVCLSSDGSVVSFQLGDLPTMGKGKGVSLIGLRKGCTLSSLVVCSDKSFGITHNNKTKWITGDDFNSLFGPRSSSKKGKKLAKGPNSKLVLR